MAWRYKPHLEGDFAKVAQIVDQQKGHAICIDRHQKNVVSPPLLSLDDETIWQTMIMCLLTSKQKSGVNDPVSIFLRENPFPLRYSEIQKRKDTYGFVRETLKGRGIRNWETKIPSFATENYDTLEGRIKFFQGSWKNLRTRAEELFNQRREAYPPYNTKHYGLERKSAEFVDDTYKGFGPKQSRNFWQALGLTRYTAVIDSRIMSWCKEHFGSAWGYYDPNDVKDYLEMELCIRQICEKAKVLPCEFDAAVFSTFENDVEAASICRGD